MKVLEYIKQNGLKALEENLAIKVRKDILDGYPVYTLNYCQIESPKLDPIARECRGLTIAFSYSNTPCVVARSFDRFFNEGESGCDIPPNPKDWIAYEKVDGSLIRIFKLNETWYVGTRGTVSTDSCMPSGRFYVQSVIDLIEKKSGMGFQEYCEIHFDEDWTVVAEFCSPDNRIVTRYEEDTLYLLAVRNKNTGEYIQLGETNPFVLPKSYKFASIEDCVTSAKGLTDLQEGYVVYNSYGYPCGKLKSPAYVAAHRLRGETAPTPKRFAAIVVENEQDEYLSVFQEDAPKFQEYIDAMNDMLMDAAFIHSELKHITDRKQFAVALTAKKFPMEGIFFRCFGKAFEHIGHEFVKLDTNKKVRMLLTYMGLE
jgi:T4 RnlA family RNA ligase